MVRRVFVEKREGFNTEALRLKAELIDFLGSRYAELHNLENLRILRRYDVDVPGRQLSGEQFEVLAASVFSEPQCDRVFTGLPAPEGKNSRHFGIEYAPGQYDQRADSAEQCAALVTGIRPRIKTASIYIFESSKKPLSDETLEGLKKYLINPVDSREAPEELALNLDEEEAALQDVPVLEGFIDSHTAEPEDWAKKYGLAMSAEDLGFCREYFIREVRDPTLTELRLLDTYWSDHCRHTTFTANLEINPEDSKQGTGPEKALAMYMAARQEVYGGQTRPITLMDLATIGAKLLGKRGLCADVDVSAEINACTIRIEAEFPDRREPWLLLFKNETHNHPTEIEPFGGAATCLGGAIRDPLSGRAFVHQAMRITGGGDPRANAAETLPGKLPQVKLARFAAAGYSSYGNQIGLATGQVSEFYHPGFLAKRLELGAVIGAVPEAWVRREEPAPGDLVILVGGRTGRDGIGGATGSSKVHTGESVERFGAEVQKGNAVEERKLQRLFRNQRVCGLIKRCNDFGAGGVSVAVGELAAGLEINLDAVPKKYAGLDGTELAISESQERMAVVVKADDAEAFIAEAATENLEATIIASVTAGGDDPKARLCMNWQGKIIVDLSREFLNSSGAPRGAAVSLPARVCFNTEKKNESIPPEALLDQLERELRSLRSGSRRGLQERFDGSIGAASVLFPWGGKEQGTPECGMAALLPSLENQILSASLMSFGYDPNVLAADPYEGAKGSIREALAKFCCLGGDYKKARLSLQEYFERPRTKESWGRPAAALLGALEAQIRLGVPAIGGKDSMSGNYQSQDLDLAVPPSLVAFAAGITHASKVRSGALSGKTGNTIILLCQSPAAGDERDEWDRFAANMKTLEDLSAANLVCAAYPVGPGGIAASLSLMAFGNMVGVEAYETALSLTNEFNYQGSVLVEIEGELPSAQSDGKPWTIAARTLGTGGSQGTGEPSGEPVFRIVRGSSAAAEDEDPASMAAEIPLKILARAYEYPLAQVFPQTSTGATAAEPAEEIPLPDFMLTAPLKGEKRKSRLSSAASPLVILPVFPGTNCEWDMERAFREAGAKTRQLVFRNRNQDDISSSLKELAVAIGEAQIIALSGGFSAGDEPDGSGKFIANVLRAPIISAALMEFLEQRDGLVLGICNGFQALIKVGLLPHGRFLSANQNDPKNMPTLTFNSLGRHVSRMIRTRVMSVLSPWLALEEPGTVHTIPVSHGEGRMAISETDARALFIAGQVPFCYADARGNPCLTEPDNPNGSAFAIEGLSSPDGRILGKMAHSERQGKYVHVNIPGNKKQNIFKAGVLYFK